ncbi:unnamed protein product [Urochloa humidicola]
MTPLSLTEQERQPDDPPPPPPPRSGSSRSAPSAVARVSGGDTPAGGRGDAEREHEREREGPIGRVLSGMAALLVAAVIAGRDAVVPRRKRSTRARADTASSSSRWWRAFRLPVPSPPPVSGPRCHDCGATATPQWRSGPMGPRTLCNNCGVKRRAAGERWGPPRRRQAKMAAGTTPVSDQPQQQQIPMVSASSPPPDSHAWQGPLPEGYRMARGNAVAKRNSPSPATAAADSEQAAPQEIPGSEQPAAEAQEILEDPEYTPAPPKKNKKTNKSALSAGAGKRRCVHCGSSKTPQWREGPAGPRSLCNACGVRHRQGRLLPEYRPLASPSFEPTSHSSLHSEVLELRRQRGNNNSQHQQQQSPAPAQQQQQQPVDDSQDVDLMPMRMPRYLVGASNLHVAAAAATDDDASASNSNATGAPGTSVSGTIQVDDVVWLDPFLLDGPAPPLIVDDPDWMMGVVINRDLHAGSSSAP